MSFKYLIPLIVVLSSDAISGTHHEMPFIVSQGSQIPQHLLFDGLRSQPFPQTFQTFSAGTPFVANAVPIPQSIPQHLLSVWRTPEYAQTIPNHLLSLTQPAPIPFTGPQPLAQPLVHSFAQSLSKTVPQSFIPPHPSFSRSPLVSPAQKARTQAVQPILAPLPEPLPVSTITQRETPANPISSTALAGQSVPESVAVPAISQKESPITSTTFSATQTLTDTQTFGSSAFQTPTKPLNLAPNLPEVQNAQLANQTNGTFIAPPTPQQSQQTSQTSDVHLNDNTFADTTPAQQQPFTQPIAQTLSQPMVTTQVEPFTPEQQSTPLDSTSTVLNSNPSI
jgi:hypothetical protein